jgi:hypothetical protein
MLRFVVALPDLFVEPHGQRAERAKERDHQLRIRPPREHALFHQRRGVLDGREREQVPRRALGAGDGGMALQRDRVEVVVSDAAHAQVRAHQEQSEADDHQPRTSMRHGEGRDTREAREAGLSSAAVDGE